MGGLCKTHNIMKVRAKFQCHFIEDFPDAKHKNVLFYPVVANCEENKSFADSTPGGSLILNISYNTPACDAFESGKEYFLDIIPVE